ncbi:unnamed protein product [Notodromas monacha]|uniref:Uncharacterized protein n=1 Tax=Notodromas monacha TaxID=399045 RepID=A0A7R9C0R5_9CRUS|nr:unnamed protein product [Notodromas monacha]CAG0925323.1 unnamed protein product [Notodromas monacha]
MAMTNVVNSIKPPEKVSTSMYTNVEQTTESIQTEPTFWDSVIGEGSAQFWVKHTICGGISNCTMLFETAFDPFLVAKEIFDNLGSIFRNKTQDQTEDIFQDKSCAYIFPNKWADYNHDKSMFRNSPGPAVACQRRTSYKLLKNLDKVGNHFEPSGFPRTTEMAMTNVVNSIKPPEKVSTSGLRTWLKANVISSCCTIQSIVVYDVPHVLHETLWMYDLQFQISFVST